MINPQFVHTIKPFKVLLILLFFIQSHTIFAQQKWYACIKDQCHENGMNFNEEMDLYENELINSGLLKDKKPKSYLEFYGSVYKNDVFVTFSEERIKKWIELDRNNCTVEIEQSYPSMKEYKRVLDSIVNSSDIYYGDIVSLRSDVFTEKDLREKSIKYFLLYTFVGVQVMSMTDIDAGIARKLPPKTPIVKDKVPYKESQILNVIINGNDEITVDDFVVSIDQMVDLATLFIQSNYHEKYVIHLSNSLNTSYNKYIEVQNGLGQALLNARNQLSQELFESDYDGLTDENRKKIIKIMPQKISEADLLDQ